MGEIQIKSGNLFDGELERGSFGPAAGQEYSTNTRVRTKKNGVLLDKGTYTVTCIGSTGGMGVYVYTTESLYVKDDSVTDWTSLPLTFTLSETRLVRFVFRKTKDAAISPSDISDIQLLEGTYTSETIPEYQPYFLNKPAHQVVNGQWVDIPTHHYTNGRWQGELTSQSPLKFWADGQMLDWRVEGRTSGNLFDVKHFVDTAYCHNVVLTQLDNGIRIQATSSNDPYVNYVNGVIGQTLPVNMRNTVIPCKSNTDYTLRCAQSSRIGKYISYFDKDYKVVKNYTPFSGTPINFKTPETCVYILLRIGDSSTLSEGTTIELTDIQILEGTYTADTLPPYEPYGGVGDWDETAQRYKIPIVVEGENLFDINGDYSAYMYQGSPTCRVDNGQIIVNVAPYYFAHIKFSALIPSGQYTIKCKASANFRATRLLLTKPFDTGTWNESYKCYYADMVKNDNYYTYTFTVDEDFAIGFAISGTTGDTGTIDEIMLNEGTAAFPYEGITTTLYTDHQLMEGDSIDYATTETQIPIATGNNILTVDTAVQPKSVFVKFEG